MSGPCSAWVTLADAQADPLAVDPDGVPLDADALAEMIDVASEILWALSGRQFDGICTDTVRPLRRMYDMSDLWGAVGFATYLGAGWRGQWGVHSCGRPPERAGGCGALSEITLGREPIREILEVRIDGAVVDPASYRIDDARWLVWIDQTGPSNGFPCCQRLDLDPLTDLDTFEVRFVWGELPPTAGAVACRRLAIELTKAASGHPCNLPERIQSFSLNGASYQLLDPMTFLDQGRTGIYLVDQFLRAFNPAGLARRAMIISPDIPRPVRRTATTEAS